VPATYRVEYTGKKIVAIIHSMQARKKRSELVALEALALEQGGYFHRSDALAHGLSDGLLRYHIGTGRFERIFPGVYRLRNVPSTPNDELILAWVWSNYRGAISHESALELYGLSDVMPVRVQITVPRDVRRLSPPFELHRADLADDDVMMHEGVQVTTPARSIVDAASWGTDPEQIQKAVKQAIQSALANSEELREAVNRKGYRYRRTVRPLVERAIQHATN
jgi:predicted transcriptional regulator of viral defense system